MKRRIGNSVALAPDRGSFKQLPLGRQTVTASANLPIIETMERRQLLSAGLMDSSFGAGGSMLIPAAANMIAESSAVAVQPNGKIDLLTVVSSDNGVSQLLQVRRLLCNGSPDTAFGNKGVTTVPAVCPSNSELIVQPDGEHPSCLR